MTVLWFDVVGRVSLAQLIRVGNRTEYAGRFGVARTLTSQEAALGVSTSSRLLDVVLVVTHVGLTLRHATHASKQCSVVYLGTAVQFHTQVMSVTPRNPQLVTLQPPSQCPICPRVDCQKGHIS